MRKLVIAVAATAFLAASACGSGGGGKTTSTTASGGAAPAAVIKTEGTTWVKNDITVRAGETVEWNVDGSIVHDLKGDDGVAHKPASKFTVTHTFKTAGTYSYQCTIHAGMNGTVTVS
jgi:plastocyanin